MEGEGRERGLFGREESSESEREREVRECVWGG